MFCIYGYNAFVFKQLFILYPIPPQLRRLKSEEFMELKTFVHFFRILNKPVVIKTLETKNASNLRPYR